ncbi:MAG TPA: AraC family transcriptional regulator, partial [Bacillota bacterium]|nr:AraC family transcriptional regulator [Bacillota bacterium]
FAEMMLIDTSENLTHISQACGFSSPDYFNKCFKALHGKTPAQYRKSFVQRARIYGKPLSEKKALELLKTYLPPSDNVFLNGISFEAVLHTDFMRTSGEDFSGLFRRRLIIDSNDDLLKLKGLERELRYLNFSSVALSYDFMNGIKNGNSLKDAESYLDSFGLPVEKLTSSLAPYMQTYSEKVRPADTAAMIFKTACPGVFLSGEKNSLFSQKAVATPYYFTFCALADISGNVTVSQEQGMAIKGHESLFIILFNKDEKRSLKYRVNIKNLPEKCCMVSKHFCGQDNQYDIPLDTGPLKIIPERLRVHLNSAFCGKTSFSSLTGANDMPVIFDLSPGSLAVVEIIKTDI